ncbi:ZapG family protein [Glaciecola sp. 1036]|uniref:ZapG family protein n=1 Tax=Alteromonadaceae TaxID=72275 RepID=UPI003CFF8B8E
MEPISIVVGILVGLAVGGIAGYKVAAGKANNKSAQIAETETEIKQLVAQKAQVHIASSREAIESMQVQLQNMQNKLNAFEANLQESNNADSSNAFFGEHTSLFLRNSKDLSAVERSAQTTEAQPLDFSNSGSGLFVGNSNEEKLTK